MNFSFLFGILLLIQQTNGSDQITLTHQGKVVSAVSRFEFFSPYFGLPIIDQKKFDEYLERLDKLVYKEPVNAALDSSGNIIPEKIGSRLSRQAFTEQVYGFYFGKSLTQMEIPILPLYPIVDTELLGHIRTKRIGRYMTSFNSNNKMRSINISLAAKAINNVVVFPGESFSFNKAVGKRTAEKGYLRAPVIIRGELSEDIGGGICQVSSTLFNAVDNAGLKIIQRFSHTRRVPYIPPGRDATVSWYGPDFVFKNTYNQPVLIQAKTLGNYLIIKLYSSDVIQYRPKKVPSL